MTEDIHTQEETKESSTDEKPEPIRKSPADKSPSSQGGSGSPEESISKLIMGRRPLMYIKTHEEERALVLIEKALKRIQKAGNVFTGAVPVYRWSVTTGLAGKEDDQSLHNPGLLLDYIASYTSPGLFLLCDFHRHFAESPVLIRKLRDLYFTLRDRSIFVVIVSGVKVIPDEAQSEISYISLELPGLDELRDFIEKELKPEECQRFELEEKEIVNLSRTLQGLSAKEARHALLAALASSKDRKELFFNLQNEKKLEARKQSIVEYIPEHVPVDHIGGLENLKDWLSKRKALMHLEGAYDSEIIPKGILLMGISGCGKSLSIKAIASLWELPLYRLDMIRVYSGAFGSPEDAFMRACETMERIAPALLWIDEIEMGIQPGEREAGGTAARIFGFFLTWMQEKKSGLFLAATANRIDLLPAEILRRGRFDQIFFIDLPSEKERYEIFRIHLAKRGINPSLFDLNLMVELTDGCNGAEIEQCVVSAVIEAKIAGHELTQKDLLAAKRLIVPLSKTMGEQVRKIRQWAFNRATPASPDKPAASPI